MKNWNYFKPRRNASIRLRNWDYRSKGAYFITICTKNRRHYFGQIKEKQMVYSAAGNVARNLWLEIPQHSNAVRLGTMVVMPNHIHGIIVLTHSNYNNDPEPLVGPRRFQHIGKNSISSIVGSYKSAVTKHLRRQGIDFEWQSRFYDRIIRNPFEYHRIDNYISMNPAKWQTQ